MRVCVCVCARVCVCVASLNQPRQSASTVARVRVLARVSACAVVRDIAGEGEGEGVAESSLDGPVGSDVGLDIPPMPDLAPVQGESRGVKTNRRVGRLLDSVPCHTQARPMRECGAREPN